MALDKLEADERVRFSPLAFMLGSPLALITMVPLLSGVGVHVGHGSFIPLSIGLSIVGFALGTVATSFRILMRRRLGDRRASRIASRGLVVATAVAAVVIAGLIRGLIATSR